MSSCEKAKRFNIWNPSDIDLSQDRRDWQGLADAQQDVLLRLSALFQAGEEAVTLDPLRRRGFSPALSDAEESRLGFATRKSHIGQPASSTL